MNICIEAHVLNHHRRSGLMTYTQGLITSMQQWDKDNHYTLAYYSLRRNREDMPGPLGNNFQKAVIRVPDQEFPGRQWGVDHLALPGFLKAHKIRIFHRTCGYTIPAVNNVFRILTVHDLRTLTIADQKWKQNITHYKKTLQALDACVVVSECTKGDLLKHFSMDERKIRVIYLGADRRFHPCDQKDIEAVKAKYGIKGPFLLSIGSVPRKNIDGTIRAFAAAKASKNFVLVLGCNMDVDKYKQLAVFLGVEQKILFLDCLDDQEIVALYSGCRCFVFPSFYEGFGLPILEAMQCGAPVITSNVSSCPEVAGDAAILVNPDNIQEISDAIDQMCQNENLRQGFIQKGVQRSKLFNWDTYAREMKKVYDLA